MTLQEKFYPLVHKGDSTVSPDELAKQAASITKEYMKGFAEWMWENNFISTSALSPMFSHIGSPKRFTIEELIEIYLKENKLT